MSHRLRALEIPKFFLNIIMGVFCLFLHWYKSAINGATHRKWLTAAPDLSLFLWLGLLLKVTLPKLFFNSVIKVKNQTSLPGNHKEGRNRKQKFKKVLLQSNMPEYVKLYNNTDIWVKYTSVCDFNTLIARWIKNVKVYKRCKKNHIS